MSVPAGPWASQVYATSLYAPIFVGMVLCQPLYGLFLGRAANLYSDAELWREHSPRYRAFLIGISILLTIYTAFTVEEISYWGVLQDRSVERMLMGHAAGNVVPALGGIIVALVQGALAIRASALCGSPRRRMLFLGLIAFLVFVSLFAGAAIVLANSILYLLQDETRMPYSFNKATAVWSGVAALADILISAMLYYGLRKRMLGFNEVTDGALRTLTYVALRTGAFTGVFHLITFGLALGSPEDSLLLTCSPYATFVPLPGLACLSLFTTLGSIRTVRDKFQPSLSLAGLDSVIQPVPFRGSADHSGLPKRSPKPSFPDALDEDDTTTVEHDDSVEDLEGEDLEWTRRARELEGGMETETEKVAV